MGRGWIFHIVSTHAFVVGFSTLFLRVFPWLDFPRCFYACFRGWIFHVVSTRAFEDVRTYEMPALCLGTPGPRQKGAGTL